MFDSYIICATPRSGSTLLCDLLAGTGRTGAPNSFYRRQSIPNWVRRWGLDPDAPGFERTYLEVARQMGTAGTGMFGMRQMWDHKASMDAVFARLFPDLSELDRLRYAFGTIRFLYLRRDDLVAQAVSRAKAEQSGLWHQHADGTAREQVGIRREPTYDRTQIAMFVAEAEADNQQWEDWFTAYDIEPLRLTYETLSADPQETLDRIMADFGLDQAVATVKSQKLSDAVSGDWIERFRNET